MNRPATAVCSACSRNAQPSVISVPSGIWRRKPTLTGKRFNSTISQAPTDEQPTAGPCRSHIFNVNHYIPSGHHVPLRVKRHSEFRAAYKENMSVEEIDERKRWWADPWYRLSKSPRRFCILSRQRLPNGFLVNFRPTKVTVEEKAKGVTADEGRKHGRTQLVLLPDRLLHPRFAPNKSGFGYWTILRRDIVGRLHRPGPHLGRLQIPHLKIPPNLMEMVQDQLEQRVVQEMELLLERLRGSTSRVEQRIKYRDLAIPGHASPHAVVWRLDEDEAKKVLEQGCYDKEEAVALLDIRGITSTSSESYQSSPSILPHPDVPTESTSSNTTSTSVDTHSKTERTEPLDGVTDIRTKSRTIPLYKLSSFIPSTSYSTLSKLITDLLTIEKLEHDRATLAAQISSNSLSPSPPAAPLPSSSSPPPPPPSSSSPLDTTSITRLPSPARPPNPDILVISSWIVPGGKLPPRTKPGDLGVPLAIALWRLGCWHGRGWQEFDVDIKGRKV